MAKCDFLVEDRSVIGDHNKGVATTEPRICIARVSVGDIDIACIQSNPTNNCPIALYRSGKITLEKANELLIAQR